MASENLKEYDVALSYATEDKNHAEELARRLQEAGAKVFFDGFDIIRAEIWGQNLESYLYRVFKDRAEFCIILHSKAHSQKKYTAHETRAALSRALQEKDRAYILPILLDETPLEGSLETLGYIKIQEGISHIVNFVVTKIAARRNQCHVPLQESDTIYYTPGASYRGIARVSLHLPPSQHHDITKPIYRLSARGIPDLDVRALQRRRQRADRNSAPQLFSRFHRIWSFSTMIVYEPIGRRLYSKGDWLRLESLIFDDPWTDEHLERMALLIKALWAIARDSIGESSDIRYEQDDWVDFKRFLEHGEQKT